MADKIIVIGAGVTGLGAAWQLEKRRHDAYHVFEAALYPGGLASSFVDKQGFVWDFAVHVAHSHYDYFDHLMDELLPDGFLQHKRQSWIHQYDCWIPYPFQYNLRYLPPVIRDECLDGLAALQKKGCAADRTSFYTWICSTAGAGIARHFMLPYNQKLWTLSADKMSLHWLGERVPAINYGRVLENVRKQTDDVGWGVNASFSFPKFGGTGAIWKALVSKLPVEKVTFGVRLIGLDTDRQIAFFSNGQEKSYDYLISTIPITQLAQMVGRQSVLDEARCLRHNQIHVVGVALNRSMPDVLREKTWVYTPGNVPFFRFTPFSMFSPHLTPDPERNSSLLCEIACPENNTESTESFVDQTLQGLTQIGAIENGNDVDHLHLMHSTYGYPIPTLDRDIHLAFLFDKLEALHIKSRGRFGGWKYEVANMDHSLMQGVEAVNQILSGQPEMTLFQPDVVNSAKI